MEPVASEELRMRYEELTGPLEGWTHDENGVIHTECGYRATAKQIESALWMLDVFRSEGRKHLIRSDEAAGALRPLCEASDYSSEVAPTRLRGCVP